MASLKSENQQHHLHLLFSRRMAPYTRLKPEQRNAVIGARLNRVPMREISKNMQIPERTVRRTWAKRFERDDEQHDLPRSGRNRTSTIEADKRLHRHLRISPDLHWAQVVELSTLSRTQIQQRLRELDPNFGPKRALWAPYISPLNQRKRDRYAYDYGDYRSEWWANVLATDECTIEIGSGRAREWRWMHSGEQWLPEHMAIRSANHETVMIWCAMRADGCLWWCFVDEYYEKETTVTGAVYARLLRDQLPQIYEAGQAWLQDNAPVHNARVAKAVLEELGVWSLPHPATSPDLNPIEHLWFRIKELVHKRHPELTTMRGSKDTRKDALKQAIREAFDEITSDNEWELPAILLVSMLKCLAAVKLVQGKQTRY